MLAEYIIISIIILQVSCNKIYHVRASDIWVKEVTNCIMYIGKKFYHKKPKLFYFFHFCDKQFKSNRIIRQIMNFLREGCKMNNFRFASNDDVTKEHLKDSCTQLFESNYILNNSAWLVNGVIITPHFIPLLLFHP